MLPRQVEYIGGSIGIFSAKYRSLIGKNVGVTGGAFMQISREMTVILSEMQSITTITSAMFYCNLYHVYVIVAALQKWIQEFWFCEREHEMSPLASTLKPVVESVVVLPQKNLKCPMLSDEF